jgi:signal transduction histidine kinase
LWVEIEQVLRESESRAVAGQFSAAIMHEINNPLEAISNLAYLVEGEADNPVKVREYIALLQGEVANVIRIARQTLSFHKPSDVRLPVNLTEVAESALRVHERRIAAKKVRLVKDLADEFRIEVHPGEMLQVFSNLLGNALDAFPDNGTLHLRFRKRDDQVHVTVADDGSGIPQEIFSRVFTPCVWQLTLAHLRKLTLAHLWKLSGPGSWLSNAIFILRFCSCLSPWSVGSDSCPCRFR